MNTPLTPATPSQGQKAFQKSHDVKTGRRLPSRTARAALLILLIAAVSTVAALPGSHAAAGKEPAVARGSVPHNAPSLGAPATLAPAPRASAVTPLTPFLLRVDPPPVETFDPADCSTPKSSWALGGDVCVAVSAPTSPDRVLRRVQLVNPAGLLVDSIDVTSTPQTVTFTLPSATTYPYSAYPFVGLTLDNRGTWRVNLVETTDSTVLYSVPITVHDATTTTKVADLQISKFLIGSTQATAGTDIQSVIWVFNAGPDAAVNARFTDLPPSNTTFQSLTQTSGPTFNCTTPAANTAGTSQCTIASLDNGETAGFIVTYKVNAGVGNATELTNSATATSDTTETTSNNNTTDETVTASNPSPPACTMTCPDNITVEAAQGQTGAVVTYTAPALVGSCGSTTTSTSPASGAVFPIGSTVVTSTATDGQSCSFVVTVTPYQDTTAPSFTTCQTDITVNESSASANSAPVPYSVSASDDSGHVTVNCGPLASGANFPVGTTEVRCTATDPAGNISECDFNVTVNDIACSIEAGSAAPVPNVASLPDITAACSVTLLAANDPTATDACGGTISGDTVSDRTYNAPGTYTVAWTYNDGTHTTTQNQRVVILPDNSAPVPDAASLPTVTGECSAAITGAPPTATDNCNGSGIVGVPLDPLSYTTAGTHVVRWSFTDTAGNTAIQNQNVVVTDTHPPVVTLTGSSSVTVECHTSYTDLGATATDNCSAPVTPTSSSDVNVNVPGTYHVVWSATDGGNNTASATRTVVVSDTIKPVITLNGANPITILLHSTFTDPGASASDSCAGSFAATASGTVNNNAVGTYTITYNATDPSGNAAIPVTRTVMVIYDFSGFFSPVNNAALNQANAGRSIPVKFNLGGNQGLGIMAAGSPYSQQVTCGSTNPTDLQETGTAGNSSLTYDTNQYVYVWKTESSWAGTCRVLTVALIDGTTHTATFKFK